MSHQWGRGKAFLARRETLARSLAKLDESLWLPFVSKCILQTRGLEISPQNRLKRREIFPAREPAMIGFYAAKWLPFQAIAALFANGESTVQNCKPAGRVGICRSATQTFHRCVSHRFWIYCLMRRFTRKRWLLTVFSSELRAFAGFNLFLQRPLSKHCVFWKLRIRWS